MAKVERRLFETIVAGLLEMTVDEDAADLRPADGSHHAPVLVAVPSLCRAKTD
jgi:hypothetical protein